MYMRSSLPIASLAAVVILGFNAQGERPAAAKEIQKVEARIDQIEVETLAQLQSGPLGFSEKIELLGKRPDAVVARLLGLLPYAGDRLHRPGQFAERHNRLLSWIGSDQVQRQETANPYLCHIRARASLRCISGRLHRGKLLGYARHRHPVE